MKLLCAGYKALPIGSGRRTIRFWLRWLVVACILPAVLVTAFLLVQSYESERARLEASTVATARALGQAVDRELAGVQSAMQVLATSPDLVSGDLGRFYDQAKQVLTTQAIDNIVLADPDGQQRLNTLRPFGESFPRYGNSNQLNRVIETGRPVLSDLFIGPVARQPRIGIGVPVLSDGHVVYGLSAGIVPARLGEILLQQRISSGWVVAIVDNAGTIVARTHDPDQFVGKKAAAPLLRAMAETSEGVVETNTLEGIPVVAGYSRSGTTGWTVAIGVPTTTLTANLRRSLLLNAGAAVLALMLGVWLAGIISGRIIRSIRVLTTSTSTLAPYGTLSIAPTKITEVDELGQVLDRTMRERDRAQSVIAEREARLRSIIETSPDAIITIDERGMVQSFSGAAEKLFGYTAAEVIGHNVKMLMPAPHRENHDSYLGRYLRTGEKRIIGIGRQVDAQRKDGTVFPMQLAIGEFKQGGTRVFSGFITDLTSRIKIEQDLRQAQKMEAIGNLTGGVAHDLNNLLTVIIGNLEILEGRVIDVRDRKRLKDAQEASRLGAELANRLLAFGRRQSLTPKPIGIKALVEGITGLLRHSLGAMIAIETRHAEGLPMVMADPGQIENALLNLAINARDAMPTGGRLVIETARAEIDESYAAAHHDVAAGNYVTLSVTDTGAGMTPEVQQHAFEPFYTTKAPGAGSGLGLSMIFGFVKQSGGHIEIDSKLGHGTTVRLYLPVPKDGANGTEQQGAAPAARVVARDASGKTVLVVEDDHLLRTLSVDRLKYLGYTVIEADCGSTAVDVLDREEPIDLLFTDIVMPGGMTGVELAREARRRRPKLKILFTSGYAEPAEIESGKLVTNAGWLGKPYGIDDLQAKLRELFDGLEPAPVRPTVTDLTKT